MNAPLYPFQADAAARVAGDERIYLGFDPGLGKSRTALEAAKRRKAQTVLIICPASGRYVWERECGLWWPTMPFTTVSGPSDLGKLSLLPGIVLITYGLLSQKGSPYVDAVAMRTRPFDMTILDEAAAVKNTGANRTRAILGKMFSKLGYLLPLSGTPAPNHAGELYPILRALHPSAIQAGRSVMTQWEFEDVFCRVVSKRFGGGPSVRVIEGSKNLPELRRRLEGFMVRVRKEDVLKDLPPIRYDVVPLAVSSMAQPAMPDIVDDDAFLRYLSASGEEHIMRLRRLLGVAKCLPAIEYIDDFLTNLPASKKVLVFAHHTSVIDGLIQGLADWQPAMIVGASTTKERTAAVNRFLGDHSCRIIIGNIQAAGTGLTLVGPNCDCSDVIFVESSFSAADNAQAACRVHRIGQSEAVIARFLTAHGTIDDRIQSILARKAKDFDQLFN
jgi:SWI/SNF-related matrix-associated actin-dependent regulator 1 of chromatin subfamily A